MLKIVKANEQLPESSLIAMIYGSPGLGKTSTAFTCDDVLLIDTDNGAKRSAFRKDIVLVSSWNDIASINADDIVDYKTIALDTVGRALDFLSQDIIQENPKMGYKGALTLQGYGQLKSRFATWVKGLTLLKKDLVLLAHDKEDKVDETLIIRPDIQGGSYQEVFKICDLVGYLHQQADDKLISFNPTDRWHGKNQGLAGDLIVPDYNREPNFFATVIQQAKDNINKLSDEQKEIVGAINQWRDKIDECEDIDTFNDLFKHGHELEDGTVKKQVGPLLKAKSMALEATFDRDKGEWVGSTIESPDEPVNESKQDSEAEPKTTQKKATKKPTKKAVSKKISPIDQIAQCETEDDLEAVMANLSSSEKFETLYKPMILERSKEIANV